MTTPSLADYAVDALVRVRSMEDNLSKDHPMRHVVRGMRAVAERTLENAMRESVQLSYQARQLVKDYDDAIAEVSNAKETK